MNSSQTVQSKEYRDWLVVAVQGLNAGDRSVEEQVRERLWNSAYLELRRISCEVRDRVLCLSGHVSSYYLCQIAQTLLRGLEGVEAIDNQLEVISRPQV